jgi:predicted DNA binding CopG/RHH family protein
MTKATRTKKSKPLSVFKSEDEERKFWAELDSMEYLDWSKPELVTFPNLKPTARTISLRLPESMITNLKILANKRDVPCQSPLQTFLADRVWWELKRSSEGRRDRLIPLLSQAILQVQAAKRRLPKSTFQLPSLGPSAFPTRSPL